MLSHCTFGKYSHKQNWYSVTGSLILSPFFLGNLQAILPLLWHPIIHDRSVPPNAVPPPSDSTSSDAVRSYKPWSCRYPCSTTIQTWRNVQLVQGQIGKLTSKKVAATRSRFSSVALAWHSERRREFVGCSDCGAGSWRNHAPGKKECSLRFCLDQKFKLWKMLHRILRHLHGELNIDKIKN